MRLSETITEKDREQPACHRSSGSYADRGRAIEDAQAPLRRAQVSREGRGAILEEYPPEQCAPQKKLEG